MNKFPVNPSSRPGDWDYLGRDTVESAEFIEAPIELDEFHGHEALDRCEMLRSMVSMWLIDHPFVQQHGDVLALVETAANSLAAAYQLIGIRRVEAE